MPASAPNIVGLNYIVAQSTSPFLSLLYNTTYCMDTQCFVWGHQEQCCYEHSYKHFLVHLCLSFFPLNIYISKLNYVKYILDYFIYVKE